MTCLLAVNVSILLLAKVKPSSKVNRPDQVSKRKQMKINANMIRDRFSRKPAQGFGGK